MSGFWNGRKAAVSLTFDDFLPSQIDNAIPLLNQAGLPGTFFVIVNSEYDTEFRASVMMEAIAHGHEIGSHTVNHRKAASLSPEEADFEVKYSKDYIENAISAPVRSFCYPYTDAPPHLQGPVSRLYRQARGGRVAREDKFVQPGDGVNLMNVPALHVGPSPIYQGWHHRWVEDVLSKEAWLTLMFHGVGKPGDWDNISNTQFAYLLEMLKARDIWVATFADAAEWLRTNG